MSKNVKTEVFDTPEAFDARLRERAQKSDKQGAAREVLKKIHDKR